MPIRNYVFNERFTPTNFNTYSINNGLKWLSSTYSNGVATSLFSDVFTTEYDSYRIVLDSLRTNTVDSFNVRMRTISGDYVSASYFYAWNGVLWSSSTAIGTNASATTIINIADSTSGRNTSATIELNSVNPGVPTMHWQAVDNRYNCNRIGTGMVFNSGNYVGIKVFSAQNRAFLAGAMHIYGYRKP